MRKTTEGVVEKSHFHRPQRTDGRVLSNLAPVQELSECASRIGFRNSSQVLHRVGISREDVNLSVL